VSARKEQIKLPKSLSTERLLELARDVIDPDMSLGPQDVEDLRRALIELADRMNMGAREDVSALKKALDK
jgi:hypothetical protein